MLSHDPAEPGHPGDTGPLPQPALSTRPAPTGLVDVPIAPVVAPPRTRRRAWPLAIALVLVTVMGGGALFVSGYSLGREAAGAPGTPASELDTWRPFWDVYRAIRDRYPIEPIPGETLVEGAIRGMVESVGDPYSSYLSPADYGKSIRDISGEFEGIGAEIGTVDAFGNTTDCAEFGANCQLVIISPLEGSPAEKAGLRPGDIIAAVDGSTLDGLTPDQARDRIRGKAGTEVRLAIVRLAPTPAPSASAAAPSTSPLPSGAAPASTPAATPAATPRVLESFDVTVVRAKIQRKEVISRDLSGGTVGYIHLTGFSTSGADDFKATVKAFVDRKISKLVVDLRGNPGGFTTAARTVASTFIGQGPIFWQQDADGNLQQIDAEAGGPATDASIRVAVLIDRGTASASEIVAGALQDLKRATLVGETTYGKGTVQEWLDLGETGAVKLTVYKWLTPLKRWIHTTGLTPDVPVEVPADTPAGEDPVLDAALEALDASTAAAGTAVWLRAA